MIFKSFMDEVKDPLDVYLRVQDLVPSWRLFYNKRKGRYEVHDTKSHDWHTLVSVLPFSQVDQRTIDYLKKNNRQHFGKVMREIEDNNADIARRQMYERQVALEQALRRPPS